MMDKISSIQDLNDRLNHTLAAIGNIDLVAISNRFGVSSLR